MPAGPSNGVPGGALSAAPYRLTVMKKPRTMADLIAHPAVWSHSDERRGGIANDGLWFYLAPGWIAPGSMTGTVHEYTVADCCEEIAAAYYCPEQWVGEYSIPGRPTELLPGA